MADRPVEPIEVAQLVEQFASAQIRDAAMYSNREVLDESGVYSLHIVAARIYALGFNAGVSVETWRESAQRQRDRDAAALTEGSDTDG